MYFLSLVPGERIHLQVVIQVILHGLIIDLVSPGQLVGACPQIGLGVCLHSVDERHVYEAHAVHGRQQEGDELTLQGLVEANECLIK